MLRVKVSPKVKYSPVYARGTVAERNNAVSASCEELYNKIVANLPEDRIPIKILRNITKSVLKEPKRIEILELKSSSYSGENDFIYARDDINCTDFLGQIISIPMKRHKLSEIFVPPYMHEMTHAFDTLFHPKYTARTMSVLKNELLSCKYMGCYNSSLYNYEKYANEQDKDKILKRVEKDIKKVFDENMNASEKVSILQSMRYDLESELKAFTEELKYAKKMLESKREVLGCYLKENNIACLMFPEKINLIKKIAFDIIRKERAKHAVQFGKPSPSEH